LGVEFRGFSIDFGRIFYVLQAFITGTDSFGGGVLTGVTGQNIPPAGVNPGILWPRPIYIPGYILA